MLKYREEWAFVSPRGGGGPYENPVWSTQFDDKPTQHRDLQTRSKYIDIVAWWTVNN
jgi:hypothetical protein